MAYRLFERREHSSLYQKYMMREPAEVPKMILSYLEEKKGKPFEIAVDAGCGTGESTRILAPHFQKVVGIDISKTQIQEAEMAGSAPNVSYLVAAAEQLPFEDNSVDLITASVAAHWFDIQKFLQEVDRVLKPCGCLAMYSINLHCDLFYGNCSDRLTEFFSEEIEFLINEHGNERFGLMVSEYKEIFDAVPFTDKKRVTKILMRRPISVSSIVGLVESLCLWQTFSQKDREGAETFLCKLQERFLKTMGTSCTDTELEISNNYFCVLASKPAR